MNEIATAIVALKLEAFEDRGKADFITSTDFEDIICLFNGRHSLVAEILSEEVVRKEICSRFARYVLDPTLEDAVLGFVQTESDSEMRFESIMNAMRSLAVSVE